MGKNTGLDPNYDYKFTARTATEAIRWFKQKIIQLRSDQQKINNKNSRLTQTSILESLPDVNVFQTGKLYLFNYDPIGRENLPYYDTFPLILLTDIKNDGFYGINLHYLPVQQRMVFLSNIVPQKGMYRDGQLQRLFISYESIKDVQEFQLFKPCFKKYKKSRVRSKIKMIPIEDWGFAAMLPIEAFKKQSKQQVWKDSMESQDMTL